MSVLLEALAIVGALICGAFSYRAFRQFQNEWAFTIRTESGIDEAIFVRLGGIEQCVQIRGENRCNPVLLFSTAVWLYPTWRSRHFSSGGKKSSSLCNGIDVGSAKPLAATAEADMAK